MALPARLADCRNDGQTECQYSQGELERAAASIVIAVHGAFKDPSSVKSERARGFLETEARA
eukprot:1560184-Pyramimonas_sp.AAC.1